MAQAFLVFDFDANEEAAQQARHRVDGWKQGFRLGNKLQCKFERISDGSGADSTTESSPAHEDKGKKKNTNGKAADSDAGGRVRLFIRLDFSNHEKHLFQSWIKRIPNEEPFKSAKSEIVLSNENGFQKTHDLYESLT